MLMWVAVCDNRYNQSGKQVRLEKSRVRQRKIGGEQSKLEQEQEEVLANVNKMRKILASQQVLAESSTCQPLKCWRMVLSIPGSSCLEFTASPHP